MANVVYNLEELVTEDLLDIFATMMYQDLNLNFGDMLLEAMNYNATCTCFCKCKEGGYNIAWITETGTEYLKTFSTEEIISSMKDKYVKIESFVGRKEDM